MSGKETFWSSWQERLSALRNVPPILRIVWQSGPGVVTFGISARLLAALLPVALAWIPKLIVDILVDLSKHPVPVPVRLWWLVGAEFALAVAGSIVTRIIDYTDSLLANKYTRYVSIQVMKHASELDLTAYEDPVYYDRLERARVQATDRLVMIQSIGRLELQVITAVTMSVAVMVYSPWLMLLLTLAVLPAFLGESHFAFLGYAKNFRQTPIKRQLDYLRAVGGTKEAAKELKLFSLSQFFTGRFARLSEIIYEQDVQLARRRLGVGSVLSLV
ncbi:MAG: ABC transporter ATP-binding protein, partial [Acidobacteria bacterium]|nr:ABC transporter ATP-binding protein [Acidobacteriota bacterium]